jgi:hypothetical protein
MEQYRCEPPFWINPFVLFRHFSLQYIPSCRHSPWNFAARILLLSFIVGLIGSVFGDLSFIAVALLFGIITAGVIIMMTDKPVSTPTDRSNQLQENPIQQRSVNDYKELPLVANVDPSRSKQNYTATEHFVNGGSALHGVQPYSGDVIGMIEVDATPYSGPSLPDYTPPTSRNLFMNVLLDEYKYNPNRPEAAPVGNATVKQTLDDYFRVHWFSDPTDVFGKNQNQRQFVTQPSTTVPNDQGSFANWLYKIPGKTCKEGGRAACLSGTDGGVMPWLSQAS